MDDVEVPDITEQELQEFATALLALATALLALAEDEDNELLGTLLLALCEDLQPRSQRYGPRGPYSVEAREKVADVLLNYASARRFKAWMRMLHDAFWHLHNLIEHNEIFVSTGRKPQRLVKYQLMAFLIKYGGESLIKTASTLAFGDGTTHIYSQ
ncbi:hypothetical protein B0H21DRAFT_894924 [Amylocystis lapponica]|nr:hypothetical protein B0H21DRAFT_894924 [Amylocystis lapponica]